MTEGTRSYAYPVVTGRLAVDELPARRWVECASCVESKDFDHTTEAEAWAELHFKEKPAHDRYRIVRQIGWRFVPGAIEPEPADL
ncbi:hypothetical protein [Streptomyces sp. NPDC004528]|uniref:DUF7848 domain-containing protein n=1 Tax=Streptomyces sp. NPDC004528 TaxID=3154550 RepID=UPI0033BEBA4A